MGQTPRRQSRWQLECVGVPAHPEGPAGISPTSEPPACIGRFCNQHLMSASYKYTPISVYCNLKYYKLSFWRCIFAGGVCAKIPTGEKAMQPQSIFTPIKPIQDHQNRCHRLEFDSGLGHQCNILSSAITAQTRTNTGFLDRHGFGKVQPLHLFAYGKP